MVSPRGPGVVVKAARLGSRSRLKPLSGIQVSKKQNVSSPLTRKYMKRRWQSLTRFYP